jgi:hypothetical protein
MGEDCDALCPRNALEMTMHPLSLFPSRSWSCHVPNAVANANRIMPRTLLLSSRRLLIAYRGVVQRNAHGASMVAIILPDDALAT